jgi:plasmid maintenance system antidote protein VapI
MSVHHGEIIEKVIRREGPSLTDLAKIMKVNRRSIYNWFMQQRLKPETIIRIGRAMKHDFSIEFPEQFVSDDFREEPVIKGELEASFDGWKEKYINLLERYNTLLERKEVNSANTIDAAYNVMIADPNHNEFKLGLNNPPSYLFLEKCKSAGYKIKSVNQGAIQRERVVLEMGKRTVY